MLKDDFISLAFYSNVPSIDEITEEKAIKEISYYQENSNDMAYDLINYERLIFLEYYFSDNKKIQDLISKLKTTIYENYIMRKKLINRYYRKNMYF